MQFTNNTDILSRMAPDRKDMLEKMSRSMATSPVVAALAAPATSPAQETAASLSAPAAAAHASNSANFASCPTIGADGQVSMKIDIPDLIEVSTRQLTALNGLGEHMTALVNGNKKLSQLSETSNKSQSAIQQSITELMGSIKNISGTLSDAIGENTRAIQKLIERFDRVQATNADEPAQDVAAVAAEEKKPKTKAPEKSARKSTTADSECDAVPDTFMDKRSLDNNAVRNSTLLASCTTVAKKTIFARSPGQMPKQYMVNGVEQLGALSRAAKILYGFPATLIEEIKTGVTRVSGPKIIPNKSKFTWFKKPVNDSFITDVAAANVDKPSGTFPIPVGEDSWGYWLPYIGVVATPDKSNVNRLVPVAIVKGSADGKNAIQPLSAQALRHLFNTLTTDNDAIVETVNSVISSYPANADPAVVAKDIYVKTMAFHMFTAADGTTMLLPVLPDWMLYQRIISAMNGTADVKGARSKPARPTPAFDNGEDTTKPRRNSVSGDSAASKGIKDVISRASTVNGKRVDDEDDEVADISSRKRPSDSKTSAPKSRHIVLDKSDSEDSDDSDEDEESSSSSEAVHTGNTRSDNKKRDRDEDDASAAAESVEIIAHGETQSSAPPTQPDEIGGDDDDFGGFDSAPVPVPAKSNYVTIPNGKGGKYYAYLARGNPRLEELIAVKEKHLEFDPLQVTSSRDFWNLATADSEAFGIKGSEWLNYTREHEKQPNYPLSAFAGIHITSFHIYVLFSFSETPPAAKECYPMNVEFVKGATKLFFDNFVTNFMEHMGYPRVVLPVTNHELTIPKCTVIPTTEHLFNKIRSNVSSIAAYKVLLTGTKPGNGIGARMVEFIHRVLD
jgi:hypothetical protein